MKKILVHFYGYKSKAMPEAVSRLINNHSGQSIVDVVVYDQTNISRPEKFECYYNHINWDSLSSRFSYINQSKSRPGYDFFMYVDGAKMFEKNWDIELLIGSNEGKVVLSGSNNIIFDSKEYRFYPSYKKIETGEAIKTGWMIKDFFFISFDLLKSLPDISMFKYYGMEEVYSMFMANAGIPVVAIPSAWVVDNEPSILEKDFLPFSLYHNYNKVVDCFKKISNQFTGVGPLSTITGYDFSMLNYFPYQINDVDYNPTMNVDLMSERRFHETQKSLY